MICSRLSPEHMQGYHYYFTEYIRLDMVMASESKKMDHQPEISVRFNWVIPASVLRVLYNQLSVVVVSLPAAAITEVGATLPYGRTVDIIFLDSDYYPNGYP